MHGKYTNIEYTYWCGKKTHNPAGNVVCEELEVFHYNDTLYTFQLFNIISSGMLLRKKRLKEWTSSQ